MIGFLRFMIIGFVVLTVIYVLLRLYVRSLTRERLEEAWEAEGSIGARDAYVEEGIREYEASLRPKLLLLVYIVPVAVFAAVFYITNFT
ncbi:hypothetical protein [Celeribacter indicus]|uniref:Cation/multidrug efflux pump n=1 Tax=Celeribacter indicus TaxID=1208324 RepID=A0A0B5DWJ5_9RHOB|nr:hypothetical protein [Celeribacter indicus]AJE45505.1 hypothetical protein P73_0790 [Celeribacter indicus]SDW87299.1 hypothetical protein SAMN05443573_108145 [Celeribacter indicus]